ncbi:AAA family ATPase [Microcoleus sp. LAD1_D5]|uniref:AAA family ATPase n=1 Tax=Microcoleus sp. LAD1_D5 TaxID=2818813 RepID=UPI002FD3DCB7
MTRITQIDIKNFRAFYSKHTINLKNDGKNLLIYGENGSGKSSLLLAIKLLINSYIQNLEFSPHRNIFTNQDDDAFIKLTLSNNDGTGNSIHTWSETVTETGANVILSAAKTKGILDYKSLLEVYFLQRENTELNIFNLLIKNLLANYLDLRISPQSIAEEWQDIEISIPKSRGYKKQARNLQTKLDGFNNRFRELLSRLQAQATILLEYFGYSIELKLELPGMVYNSDTKQIDGKEIILTVDFLGQPIYSPHQFLNEAKLSAIALSLYLASLLIIPTSELNILVLDDVLIGLDMSNRLPIINILHDHFSHYQVFFMTYDREWYAIMKQRIEASDTQNNWLYVELFNSKIEDDLEVPVFTQDKDYLIKAEEYLENNALNASALYLRMAFEVLMKRFCEKKSLGVRYRDKPKDLTTKDFWNPILAHKRRDNHGTEVSYLDQQLVDEVELYLSLVMNPLSHSRMTTVYRQEIENAIATIKKLKQALK